MKTSCKDKRTLQIKGSRKNMLLRWAYTKSPKFKQLLHTTRNRAIVLKLRVLGLPIQLPKMRRKET